MQTALFETEAKCDFTEELFQAYFDCRKNKRNTINALLFEKHLEHNLFQLHEEILEGIYEPQSSIAFIINKPYQTYTALLLALFSIKARIRGLLL